MTATMTHAEFWGLIDTARSARLDLAPALTRILAQLPPRRIQEFGAWFWAYFMALSRNDLWAAVYIIERGCSDDSFDYFRRWLVGQGETKLLAAIHDPETLVDGVGFDELVLDAAEEAYREVSGDDFPKRRIAVEIPGLDGWPADRVESVGGWRDPFLKSLYPRLYDRYAGDRPLHPEGEITHARFWTLVEEARATGGDIAGELRRILDAGPVAERVGFARWTHRYNEALVGRRDFRGVTRVLLGKSDRETALYLRGWLLAQGEAVVQAALRDPDALATLARDPPRPYYDFYQVAHASDDEPHAVPGVEAWAADWPDLPADDGWTAALLRARLPRLTAGLSDDALDGRIDVTRLDQWKRTELADELLAEARALADDHAALALVERAVRLAPAHASTIAARGRVRARLGKIDEALADYDAAIGMVTHTPAMLLFERAQLRWAKGDREGAIRDARAASSDNPAAKRWLDEKAPKPGPPRRVRHATFGDGAVMTIVGSGDSEKLTIDFGAAGKKTMLRRFVEVLE